MKAHTGDKGSGHRQIDAEHGAGRRLILQSRKVRREAQLLRPCNLGQDEDDAASGEGVGAESLRRRFRGPVRRGGLHDASLGGS